MLTVLINAFANAWYLPVTLARTDVSRHTFAAFGTSEVGVLGLTVVTTAAALVLFLHAVGAVVLGGLLLGERHFRIRLLAAVLVAVGVTLIAP